MKAVHNKNAPRIWLTTRIGECCRGVSPTFVRCMSPQMARFGHASASAILSLSGGKRTRRYRHRGIGEIDPDRVGRLCPGGLDFDLFR